ncbi:MAG: tetratricopeptide repeat protein [Proteobacteria bacterium]|nr:tetratricopeptide repeat protein [Pseudomonadota bacterium]
MGYFSYFAADRYWYAPLAGVSILVTGGVWHGLRVNRTAFLVAFVPLMTIMGWQNLAQQRIWQDADLFHQHMLRVNPNATEGLIGLSFAAVERGELDLAKSYLNKVLPKLPSDGRVWQGLGNIAYLQGNLDLSLSQYNRALSSTQWVNKAYIYKNLRAVYDKLGQPKKAIEVLQKALEMHPHFAKAFNNLGKVNEDLGNYSQAIELYQKAIAERSDYAQAYYNLGVVLYRNEQKEESFSAFSKAREITPDDAKTLFNFASVAYETGRPEIVGPILAELEQKDPGLAERLKSEFEDYKAKKSE